MKAAESSGAGADGTGVGTAGRGAEGRGDGTGQGGAVGDPASSGSASSGSASSGSASSGSASSGSASDGSATSDSASESSTASADGGGCEARIGEFVGRMSDLRQSLLAGLSYAEYVVRVKAIRDAYEAVPVDRLGVDCLSGPARKAEEAFNQYLRAANVWGECAGTAGCAAREIEGKLQHRWAIASKSLKAATVG